MQRIRMTNGYKHYLRCKQVNIVTLRYVSYRSVNFAYFTIVGVRVILNVKVFSVTERDPFISIYIGHFSFS